MSKYENLTPGETIKLTAVWSKWEEIWGEIEEIGKKMHHNARLRELPYEDEDSEDFWEWLAFYAEQGIKELKEEVYEIHGYYLDFYSTGRSGATIYPSPWCNAHHHYQGLNNSSFYYDEYWDEPLPAFLESADQGTAIEDIIDCFEDDSRRLETLKFITSRIENGVKGIPEVWEEELKYRKENE